MPTQPTRRPDYAKQVYINKADRTLLAVIVLKTGENQADVLHRLIEAEANRIHLPAWYTPENSTKKPPG